MKYLFLVLQTRRKIVSSFKNKPTFSICHLKGDVNKRSFRTKKAGAYAEFGRNFKEPYYEELRPSSV
jgi:hypothetical protein